MPLTGVNVVQLGGRVSVAYATRLLGDLGAEILDASVRRSEARDAPPFAEALDISLGRNKVHLGAVPADEIAAILACADVVFVDEESRSLASSVAPSVVVVDVSDFGGNGRRSGWRGSDLIDVAYGGGCQQNGRPTDAPLRPPAYVAEQEIGVGAAIGALLALRAARRDGVGQRVEVSGVDSWATIQTAIGLLEFVFQGRVAGRAGRRFPGRPYPYGILPCKDGDVRLICLQGREWVRSLAMMGDPAWGKDPKFADRLTNQAEHADELDGLVGRWLGDKTKDEVLAAAIEYKVAWAPLREVEEVIHEPQLVERGFFWEHDGVLVPGYPALFSRTPAKLRRPATAPLVPVQDLAGSMPRPEAQDSVLSATTAPPLQGITVLDFGWAWAGGAVGSVLADYGADVIKIESTRRLDPMRMDRPLLGGDDGTEQSSLHHNVNRNKRSIAVDISTPEGAEIVRRLAATADVLVENMSPGALDKYGLGYRDLSELNEGLVFLSLAAVGTSGPLTGLRAYAPVLTALSGVDALTGYIGEAATGLQHGIGDPNASLHGVVSILAALHERESSGRGQLIDLSQLEALTGLIGPHIVAAQLGDEVAVNGNRDPLMAPHGTYRAAGDDDWVAIACRDDSEWKALRSVLGDPAWADARFDTLEGRLKHHDELDAALSEWTSDRDRWHAAGELQDAGVAAAPLLDTGDRFSDEHLQDRSIYAVVEHPVVGSEFIYNAPWRLSRTPGEVRSAAPLLGQHTADVLTDRLGLTVDEVDELQRADVLR